MAVDALSVSAPLPLAALLLIGWDGVAARVEGPGDPFAAGVATAVAGSAAWSFSGDPPALPNFSSLSTSPPFSSPACLLLSLTSPSRVPLLTMSYARSLPKIKNAAGAVTVQTPSTPSSLPTALSAISTMIVIKNTTPPKAAPHGSLSAFAGSAVGGRRSSGIMPGFLNTTHRRSGNSTMIEATVGRASQAEYCKKLRPKPDERTRLVGFDETSSAETRLAVWNCVKRYAVGFSIPAKREKWAKKGVPERMRGSLPTMRPVQEKKTKKATYSLRPEEAARVATWYAR